MTCFSLFNRRTLIVEICLGLAFSGDKTSVFFSFDSFVTVNSGKLSPRIFFSSLLQLFLVEIGLAFFFENPSNRLITFCYCNFDFFPGVVLLRDIQTVQHWIRNNLTFLFISLSHQRWSRFRNYVCIHNFFGTTLFSNIPAFSHRLCSRPLMSPDVILFPFHEMKT